MGRCVDLTYRWLRIISPFSAHQCCLLLWLLHGYGVGQCAAHGIYPWRTIAFHTHRSYSENLRAPSRSAYNMYYRLSSTPSLQIASLRKASKLPHLHMKEISPNRKCGDRNCFQDCRRQAPVMGLVLQHRPYHVSSTVPTNPYIWWGTTTL